MVKDIKKRLGIMRKAAEPFLADHEPRIAYWSEWEYNVVHAEWRVHGCQRQFYALRLIALISAITVPSLVGLNLSGTGGAVVRWLTFAFSLVAAISTGVLALYRVGDRWLMYRKLGEDLMRFGWTLVESSGTDPQEAWDTFTKNTDKAIADYNRTYEAAVIHAAQPKPDDAGGGQVKGAK
jgi:Protein of unknown function (DUF4231)